MVFWHTYKIVSINSYPFNSNKRPNYCVFVDIRTPFEVILVYPTVKILEFYLEKQVISLFFTENMKIYYYVYSKLT